MQKFSWVKGGIKKLVPSADITIERAVELIGSDLYKEPVEQLRAATDPSVKKVLKNALDYFMFSGTFKKRLSESLIKHSGLLCIDLDDVKDLVARKAMICTLPYVHCCFTSPTGTGLKVILRIDDKKHLESFIQAEQNFSGFGLAVDKSGKDVVRACFVSYDPEIFYNPDSEILKVLDEPASEALTHLGGTGNFPQQDSQQKALSASEQFKRNKDLARVLYCVEQIEREQFDITDNDYDDRRDVGFALSSLGEDARELYHRAVQFNDAYDPQDADYKFSDALKNSRFKTPAKFFALCKNHGLLISLPKTIDEAKKEHSALDIIGDQNSADNFLMYGIWEEDGIYWGLGKNNDRYQLSNFKMRILYHVQTSDEEAYRLIQIKNVFGFDRIVKMNTDDFVSVGSFKKVVARQGNFIWKGGDPDLCKLQDMLQREERPTELISQLGYNKRNNFYAWANGIYCCNENEFKPVDDCGIVEHFKTDKEGNQLPQNFFIPALSKMFAEKDNLYVGDKQFVYIDREVEFADWAKLFCASYDEGKMVMMWFMMCIFSDIIFREMDDRFPMLFSFGQKGTGKGTMLQSGMKLFGHGQKQLMLGGSSTVVGFMRKSGQYSNATTWLDEFKNNIKETMKESIKNLYDRIGYERGKKDNTFQTESTAVDSGVIVSGQEMPISEEALFTRFILSTKVKPREVNKVPFGKLKRLEAAGLSCITVQILRHREFVKENFRKFYEEEHKLLSTAVNNNEVIDRLFNNYASLIAMHRLLSEKEELPFNTVSFREVCRKALVEQHYVLKGNDTIGKFWSIVETLFNTDVIKENQHFQLKNGYLYIRVQEIYQYYAELMQKRRDPGVLDEATLRNYLEHDPKAFIKREKKFFGGAQRWCFIFKYVELGVDLIKANTVEELRVKYQDMGIVMDEDGEAMGVSPAPQGGSAMTKSEPIVIPAQQATMELTTEADEELPF